MLAAGLAGAGIALLTRLQVWEVLLLSGAAAALG